MTSAMIVGMSAMDIRRLRDERPFCFVPLRFMVQPFHFFIGLINRFTSMLFVLLHLGFLLNLTLMQTFSLIKSIFRNEVDKF